MRRAVGDILAFDQVYEVGFVSVLGATSHENETRQTHRCPPLSVIPSSLIPSPPKPTAAENTKKTPKPMDSAVFSAR